MSEQVTGLWLHGGKPVLPGTHQDPQLCSACVFIHDDEPGYASAAKLYEEAELFGKQVTTIHTAPQEPIGKIRRYGASIPRADMPCQPVSADQDGTVSSLLQVDWKYHLVAMITASIAGAVDGVMSRIESLAYHRWVRRIDG